VIGVSKRFHVLPPPKSIASPRRTVSPTDGLDQFERARSILMGSGKRLVEQVGGNVVA
jgi:hypothetical protein